MIKLVCLFLFIAVAAFYFDAKAQNGPPPRNLQFDTLTLVATWEPPRSILLDEHFEGAVFPPANWQDSTQGMGWFATVNGSSATLNIPPHTTYAVVNNSLAGIGNNGCCDYLITPEMDFTQAEGYTLSFNSFFRGIDAETASVEISTDGGNTWTLLLEVLPHFAWATLQIDISAYSGTAGSQHVQLAFKANDNGNANATGWAIDDVVVMSEELEVNGYGIFLDGTLMGQTGDTAVTFNPVWFPSGFPPYFCIGASYDSGYSVGACADFPHYYLAPPRNLQAIPFMGTSTFGAKLSWQLPSSPGNALLSYTIYRDNEFLANVPKTDTLYFDVNPPGEHCYKITAVYDLTEFGFPGQVGESYADGPSCCEVGVILMIPFYEDWTTSQFDVNLWTAGENWVMDGGNGNSAPAAKFTSQPQLTDYSSSLVSFYMNRGGWKSTTPCCLWLDFDYLLDDISASGTEMLTIEIVTDNTTTTLKEIANTGDAGWTKEHLNITGFASDATFRIRFTTNGVNSELINYWLVDNIKVYREFGFAPPTNLTASVTGNTQQNEIQVNWDVPQWETFAELIQDDSTWENVLTINPGYSGWLGNKFTSEAGLVRSVDIMWLNNVNSTHSPIVLDVFDANHLLLGSSEAFVPVPGSWQTVAIPDINVEGDFYAMVRFDGQSGITDYLGMDITAPSGRPNNGWFYDGTTWSQMNSFGYAECVFLMRVILRTQSSCENGDTELVANAQPKNSSSRYKKQLKSGSGTSGLVEYELFRREYQFPIPGQDSLLTEWVLIGPVQTNSYLDQNLEFKCYQYYAQAMYNEGSSQQSNTDEACFLAGVEDPDASGILLYPNPANDFLTIETYTPIDNITVFNSTGIPVIGIQHGFTSGNNDRSSIRIAVSTCPPGIYILKFTTANGESISRKFVKM